MCSVLTQAQEAYRKKRRLLGGFESLPRTDSDAATPSLHIAELEDHPTLSVENDGHSDVGIL